MTNSNQQVNSDFSSQSKSLERSKKVVIILSTLLAIACFAIIFLLTNLTKSDTRQETHNCSSICCDSPSYNFISEGSLDSMICNYRNHEWWKTSNAFNNTSSFSYQIWRQHLKMETNSRGSQASMYDSTYNSRYMDIGLDQLENYICTIRRNCQAKAQFIRFYYIRYGAECFKREFANKHSLAMIPLDAGLNEIPNAKDCNTTGDLAPLIMVSHIANHNEICPPEPPKGCSARLNNLDRNIKTYSY